MHKRFILGLVISCLSQIAFASPVELRFESTQMLEALYHKVNDQLECEKSPRIDVEAHLEIADSGNTLERKDVHKTLLIFYLAAGLPEGELGPLARSLMEQKGSVSTLFQEWRAAHLPEIDLFSRSLDLDNEWIRIVKIERTLSSLAESFAKKQMDESWRRFMINFDQFHGITRIRTFQAILVSLLLPQGPFKTDVSYYSAAAYLGAAAASGTLMAMNFIHSKVSQVELNEFKLEVLEWSELESKLESARLEHLFQAAEREISDLETELGIPKFTQIIQLIGTDFLTQTHL